MQNNQDEEPIEEQTRRIIRSLPITPNMFDGTYPAYEEFHIASPASASELSFSSESPDSDSTVHFQSVHENPTVPIIELPRTPSQEEVDPRDCTLCPDTEPLTPSSIGAALEKSGTVLMQRSLDNRLATQLEEIYSLMGKEDEELVVLKQPSVRAMSSKPAFARDVMQGFMEHSETMFNLVHDTHPNSAQFVIGIEEAEPSDSEAPGTSRTKKRFSSVAGEPAALGDDKPENEFVGCFSKDNDMVLYKRTMQDIGQKTDRADRASIDALIAHHADCLEEANKTDSPAVQVRQANGKNLLALLTFSDQSSAILKTSNALTDGVSTEEQLNRAILTTYRKLVATPDEMISMQTQSTSGTKPNPHTHQVRAGVLQNLATATSSFGLQNTSARDGLIVQGSSKNWTKYDAARYQNAAEIVLNLRMLLEEYILRETFLSATVAKFAYRVLSDVLECVAKDVGNEFRSLHVIDKIKRVFDELLMPHGLEDPLVIVNELRITIEDITNYPIETPVFEQEAEAWQYVREVFEKLSCELDHDVEHPDAFLEALQCGLNRIVVSMGKTAGKAKQGTKTVSIDPSTPVEVQSQTFPCSSSTIDMDRYEAPSVSFCKPYWWFVLQTISSLWSALVWVAVQLNVFWDFLQSPPPPILPDSSSSHANIPCESTRKRDAVDVIRIVLENDPNSSSNLDTATSKRSVNARSLQMITRLLHQMANVELKESESRHHMHLQLQPSVSGTLEKREAEEFLTMAGNVRDHDANVAIFFEAHLVDIDSIAEVESVIEFVTRVERLSEDVGGSENLSEETVVQARVKEEVDEDGPNEMDCVVSSLVEEIVSNGACEDAMSGTGAEHLLGEIKNCLQELLDPLTTAMGNFFEQFGVVEDERSYPAQPNASEHYTVELEEPNDEDGGQTIRDTECVQIVETTSSTQHCPKLCQMASSLEELLSLFHDTNDRLGMMDADITAIRNQVQQLIAIQQHRNHPRDDTKTTHGDGEQRRSHQRVRHSQKSVAKPSLPQCPMQKCLLSQLGKYCPTEVYACHAVAPDVLVVHWTVDEDMLHCIVGFEILVDGVLRSVCFSNKRRTALIDNIDLKKQHQIVLQATPDSSCRNTVDWAPAFFLYHT
uniref:Uncharacterized protein n=1 Tax=Anopheles farauti TaxID=69004 RepID=A0A182QFQ8_9DIPT